MNNIDKDTAEKLRNKFNGMFTERQKKEIMDAIKDIDKNKLSKILSECEDKIDAGDISDMMRNISKEDILEKIKRL